MPCPNDHGTEDACPICLTDPGGDTAALARGPCGHILCQACAERLLLSRAAHQSMRVDEMEGEDAALSAPTLGRCPICRSAMSLFEMRNVVDGSFLVSKDYDICHSPIAGTTYASSNAAVGIASFHFPEADAEPSGETNSEVSTPSLAERTNDGVANGNDRSTGLCNSPAPCPSHMLDADDRRLPYYSFEHSMADDLELDDGSRPPRRKYFEEGCHFHLKSNTFHGVLDWWKEERTSWHGARTWQVIMQFSSDRRYVCSGVIIKRKHLPDVGTESPLDGRWKVTWVNNDDEGNEFDGNTAEISVSAGEFDIFGCHYKVNTSARPVSFRWPRMASEEDSVITQRAVSGLDLDAEPNGPSIGSVVEWVTNHTENPKIKWVRKSVGGLPPPQVEHFGPTGLYYRLQRRVPRLRPRYHRDSVWGNVFVQMLMVGLASYHFVSEGGEGESGAYISYENPRCAVWPALDDGSPVPSRVPFINVSWDQDSRTFRGTIPWQQRYGASWQGSEAWHYEMVFDTEFMCIVSGKVITTANGVSHSVMSTFGEDLIYINAAAYDMFLGLLQANEDNRLEVQASNVETEDADDHDNGDGVNNSQGEGVQGDAGQNNSQDSAESRTFTTMSLDLRRRLSAEGASLRTTYTLHNLLASAHRLDSDNPIDFNLI